MPKGKRSSQTPQEEAAEFAEAQKMGLPEGWRVRLHKSGSSTQRRYYDPAGVCHDTLAKLSAALGYLPEGIGSGKGKGKRSATARDDTIIAAKADIPADNDGDKNELGDSAASHGGSDGDKNELGDSAASPGGDGIFGEGWEAKMGYEKYPGTRATWLPEGWMEAISHQEKAGKRKVYVSPRGTSRWDQKTVIELHQRELGKSSSSTVSTPRHAKKHKTEKRNGEKLEKPKKTEKPPGEKLEQPKEMSSSSSSSDESSASSSSSDAQDTPPPAQSDQGQKDSPTPAQSDQGAKTSDAISEVSKKESEHQNEIVSEKQTAHVSETSASRQVNPTPKSPVISSNGLPPGWEESFSDEYGIPFYWNESTGESLWERPTL